MEMWLILAVAGSGYLAKCWQNAHKNKEPVSEEADSVSGKSTNYARRRHLRVCSADGRCAQSSLEIGKWPSCRQGPRVHNVAASPKARNDAESPTDEGGISAVDNSLELQGSVNLGTSSGEKNSGSHKPAVGAELAAVEKTDDLEGTGVRSNDAQSGSCLFAPKTQHCSDNCSGALDAASESGRQIPVLNGYTEGALNKKAEGDHKCHSSENIGKMVANGRSQFVDAEDGNVLHFGFRGGKMTKEEDSQGDREMEQEGNSAMLAYDFWDESEFDGMLPPGNSPRRIEIPSRFGKGRGSVHRRGALQTSCRPWSSLESCLFAQLTGENEKLSGPVSSAFLSLPVANQRPLVIMDGDRIINKGGIRPLLHQFPNENYALFSEHVNYVKEDETAFGAPSLPTRDVKKPQCKRKELPRKNPVSRLNMVNRGNSGNPGVMVADSALLKRRKMSQFDAPASTSGSAPDECFQMQDTSVGCLLFSFGVGVGVMSTIMASRREVEKLNKLLRQTEELVQDLQEELEMQNTLTVKDLTIEGHICVETHEHPFGERDQQRDVSSDILLEKDCDIGERTLIVESGQRMEPMSRVQAELEAELEQLELNLNSSKHWRKFSGLSEIDPDYVADVVHGEFRGDGLMANAYSRQDSRASTHEEVHMGNFAVSPRELTRRLHEVLETRLQQRIVELEAELEASQNKLRSIGIEQQQLNELNKNSQSFNSGPAVPVSRTIFTANQNGISGHDRCSLKASFNGPVNQKDFDQSLGDERSDGSLSGKGLANDSYLGSELTADNRTGSAEIDIQSTDDEDSKDNQNPPLFVSLSGDALSAYNEAYDEFMKVTTGNNVCLFDSAEDKDVAISKQSIQSENPALVHLSQSDCLESNDSQKCHCSEEGELYHKYNNGISHPEPVPLLSASCSHTAGFHPQSSQLLFNSRVVHSCTALKQRELYFEGTGLKGSDFHDYVVEDTSGSIPCSLKFVDTSGLINSDTCDKSLSSDTAPDLVRLRVNACSSCKTNESATHARGGRAQLQMPLVSHFPAGLKERSFPTVSNLPEVSSLVLDKIRSWESLAVKVTPECEADGNLVQSPASDESDPASQADEQLGKLLIKRIIEKTRQGSPILRDAESMLASLDNNEF